MSIIYHPNGSGWLVIDDVTKEIIQLGKSGYLKKLDFRLFREQSSASLLKLGIVL